MSINIYKKLQLVWDDWNKKHIKKHGVEIEQVEEVCADESAIIRITHKGRFLVTGKTAEGRLISVVIDPEGTTDFYYVVTARSANKKERREYDKENKNS